MVKPGIENLANVDRTKTIGLFSNISGVNSRWERTVDIIKPKYIFTAEHGYFEEFLPGEKYFDARDPITGTPVVTIYGKENRRELSDTDILYVDIQDSGTRCFTYVNSLFKLIKKSAEIGFKIVILDRPNPISSLESFGSPEDKEFSPVSAPFIPFVYPFTIGELALFYADKANGNVEVVKMEGYKRSMFYENTGIPFSSPSPNLSSVQSVYLYPALVLSEGFDISVGRGTPKPFRWIGSPIIDIKDFSAFVKSLKIEGLLWKPAVFIPSADRFKGELCYGLEFYVTEPLKFSPLRLGFGIVQYFLENDIPLIRSGSKNFVEFLYNERIINEIEKNGADKFYRSEKEKGKEFLYDAERYFIYKN